LHRSNSPCYKRIPQKSLIGIDPNSEKNRSKLWSKMGKNEERKSQL
jgi:hypothetical protein